MQGYSAQFWVTIVALLGGLLVCVLGVMTGHMELIDKMSIPLTMIMAYWFGHRQGTVATEKKSNGSTGDSS